MAAEGRRVMDAGVTYAFLIARSMPPSLAALLDQLDAALRSRGWTAVEPDEALLVFNVIDPERPRPFRRRARRTYVAAIYDGPDDTPDIITTSYPLLVRSLANIVLAHTGEGVWFTTME